LASLNLVTRNSVLRDEENLIDETNYNVFTFSYYVTNAFKKKADFCFFFLKTIYRQLVTGAPAYARDLDKPQRFFVSVRILRASETSDRGH